MSFPRLGEMLVGNGIITPDQLEDALDRQRQDGGALGLILIKNGCITPDQLTNYLKMQEKARDR